MARLSDIGLSGNKPHKTPQEGLCVRDLSLEEFDRRMRELAEVEEDGGGYAGLLYALQHLFCTEAGEPFDDVQTLDDVAALPLSVRNGLLVGMRGFVDGLGKPKG